MSGEGEQERKQGCLLHPQELYCNQRKEEIFGYSVLIMDQETTESLNDSRIVALELCVGRGWIAWWDKMALYG